MKDKAEVVDLEEYRDRKELRELIDRLDILTEEVYYNPKDPNHVGFTNFLAYLKSLDEKYDK